MTRVRDTKSFIEKARLVHGDRYIYDKTIYKGSKFKLTVTCREHGDYDVLSEHHLRGFNCQKCTTKEQGKKRRLSLNDVIQKFNDVHGDRYDYSKVDYVTTNKKVIVICRVHGEFTVRPSNHKIGSGCPSCAKENLFMGIDRFTSRSIDVHGDRYDYSKSSYNGSDIPITITCKLHGEFNQRPSMHLSGQGCPRCAAIERGSMRGISSVYLMKSDDLGVVKIGISKSPEARAKSLTQSSGYNFQLIDVFDCASYMPAQIVEKICHARLSKFKYSGVKFGGHTECFFVDQDKARDEITSAMELIFDYL